MSARKPSARFAWLLVACLVGACADHRSELAESENVHEWEAVRYDALRADSTAVTWADIARAYHRQLAAARESLRVARPR